MTTFTPAGAHALATLAPLVLLAAVSMPAQAQVDPNRFLDAFEVTFGKFEGHRRSGAKGIPD